MLALAGAGAAAVVYYRNDLPQLQYDAAGTAGNFLKLLDAERAHDVGVWLAKNQLFPRDSRPDPPCLQTRVWGRDFSNPIGT